MVIKWSTSGRTRDHRHKKLSQVRWHSKSSQFYYEPSSDLYFNKGDEETYNTVFASTLGGIDAGTLLPFRELTLRAKLQLLNDLISNYVQFDYIQPLLKRIDSLSASLDKVIEVTDSDHPIDQKLLTVISLRRCNQEVKKLMPILLAKHYYETHKEKLTKDQPKQTLHLIIDEAHNVLSQQSTREHESWKDYRIELFEEIIKEGRKFGVFLTLASQRPADISPTIMSQVHNFFIHRLVNDKDLALLDNTISTLDRLSKSIIPNLSKGCCIITGTSFDLPIVVQIDQVEKERRPDSEDVDLGELWKDNLNTENKSQSF